jgi:hypothetical protein
MTHTLDSKTGAGSLFGLAVDGDKVYYVDDRGQHGEGASVTVVSHTCRYTQHERSCSVTRRVDRHGRLTQRRLEWTVRARSTNLGD